MKAKTKDRDEIKSRFRPSVYQQKRLKCFRISRSWNLQFQALALDDLAYMFDKLGQWLRAEVLVRA